MADEVVKILDLAKQRARNSAIAYAHKSDPELLQARIKVDQELGERQLELAKQLPEGDKVREVIEFLQELPPPLHLSQKG